MSKAIILIVTTTHLAKNPRLVKEIDALHQDYKLIVIFFQLLPHYKSFDETIIKKYPSVDFRKINWLKKYYPSRLLYTLIQKILEVFSKYSKKPAFIEQLFFAGYLPLKTLSKTIEFDFIHGHNPGCLGVVYQTAKMKKVRCGFDAEDFHSGEEQGDNFTENLADQLEQKYLPYIDLLIGASPLICAEYRKKFHDLDISVINNSFPKKQFKNHVTESNEGKLKLVWFSQNVGFDRGLGDVLNALHSIREFEVSFTIIGAYDLSVKEKLERHLRNSRHQLIFKGLLSHDDLNAGLSSYDIGIASEPGKDLNNSIALSNKIFAYAQAGLAILASNTLAQKLFMETYSGMGYVYQIGEVEVIKRLLSNFHHDRELLLASKQRAIQYAEAELNWEIESIKLKKLLAEHL